MTTRNTPVPGRAAAEEERFRTIFRRLHRDHATCRADEWLMRPCADRDGRLLDRPSVWSRRNGPWHRVAVLWVGAAPGNAGGRGKGDLGAHGTRIPFGGDVAGANLEVLLGSLGIDRNETFIVAALNRLPDRGGGEPSAREIREPAGGYRDSLALLRDTLIACGPALVVALGNVAARAVAAAWLHGAANAGMPSIGALGRAGWTRHTRIRLETLGRPTPDLEDAWSAAWGPDAGPDALWLTHPSAQNMSPFAGVDTAFHRRMIETRDELRRTARTVLGIDPPATRPPPPTEGIYALPEWRGAILPRLTMMDGLWRQRGV
jgi:uracil-DNA glycosylase